MESLSSGHVSVDTASWDEIDLNIIFARREHVISTKVSGVIGSNEVSSISRLFILRRSGEDVESSRGCVLDDELSTGRQVLAEAEETVPGTQEILNGFRNSQRRSSESRDVLLEQMTNLVSVNPVSLGPDLFVRTLRSSRWDAAADLSGMTVEYLRSMSESGADTELLTSFTDIFIKGEVPQEIVNVIRMGRMIALRKRVGDVRGIMVKDLSLTK